MPQIGHYGFVSFWTYFDSCDSDSSSNTLSLTYQEMLDKTSFFFKTSLKEKNTQKINFSIWKVENNDIMKFEDLDNKLVSKLLNDYLTSTIDSAIVNYVRCKNEGEYINIDYEEELSLLGRMLLDYDKSAALKIFSLNNAEYPDSWHTYYDLGYSYKLAGDHCLAKEILLKGQVIKPKNEEIEELLSSLPG